jgi:hypothetical protein
VHLQGDKYLSARKLRIVVVPMPRGALCRAPAVSRHRQQRIRGVSNPPVLTGWPPRTLFGGCSRPACRGHCQHRDRAREVVGQTARIADWNAVLIAA